ncbi:uncharacterized protein MONBRDRAFT_17908 [Monosiga brevicollis MX1]|uniref:U6 snRNA-associated Sm-like protein LSm8 n=1 Tax=Monosiga brevicollis TaxID=81824 RepID=A9UT55_MONBE|nr:uncharacterized protein MONBRDRAFT_17908 [Monosiga brevicollis MX1]EDQ91434.1 predicted protein [Monosiga brevicollis MX1]|eukprot:XP_001743856.1 hypothetical protein [Monosiga brevicollis MX1]
MEGYMNKAVTIATQDGRLLTGILKGFDQSTNLILNQCYERVFSLHSGVEIVPMGLYIVRGDNVAVVGETDEETDATLDLENVKAAPLNPVVY